MQPELEYVLKRFELDPVTFGRMPVEVFDSDRQDLAQLFRELTYARGVEVGTEVGRYAKMLCLANPDLHLTCVDPYEAYAEHRSQEKLNQWAVEAATRLEPYHATFMREPSVQAATAFKDGELDFVYLDGNHELSAVVADLTAWVPKVRSGGIIAGHDFRRQTAAALRRGYLVHVVEAVVGYTQAWHIKPWFVLGSKVVDGYHRRDRPRSWMWVKP